MFNKKCRGSICAYLMAFIGILTVIIVFVGFLVFQYIAVGVFHDVKNNLYMVNRNVLLALNREQMGEDQNSFFEKKAESLVQAEIERLWNQKVGVEYDTGMIRKIEIEDVKIRHEENRMYICSKLKIFLNSLVFRDVLENKLYFTVDEETKIEKMKG